MKLVYNLYPYLFIFLIGGLLTNCDGLLDADNPNNLLEENLDDPRAFNSMVNGVQATTTRAFANILTPYSVGTDEMIWIGSRDAWQQLNFGSINDINNEFTDAAFFFVAEARWWADEVISRGEGFDQSAINSDDLVRAYLYGAITYTFIADMFDDFVVDSDKREAAPAVGADKMSALYDRALGYLNKANALKANDFQILSMLARVNQAKAIWSKVNPVNTSSPLVASSEAASFAQQALAAGDADGYFKLPVISTARPGGLPIASEVNSRLEMRLSDEYVISDGKRVVSPDDGDASTSISLMDPIDNVADPALFKIVSDFANSFLDFDFVMTSTREMHLILAENALAGGDDAGFATNINNLRALDGLSDYSGQVDATELLIHSRRTNLYLQGRRLADHYRFDDPSVYWLDGRPAKSNPGTFFPITISEIQANPNIN